MKLGQLFTTDKEKVVTDPKKVSLLTEIFKEEIKNIFNSVKINTENIAESVKLIVESIKEIDLSKIGDKVMKKNNMKSFSSTSSQNREALLEALKGSLV